MSLALSEAQFSSFFQFLKEDVESLEIVKAVTHIGGQSNGVWVLNKETQINADGEVIPKQDQEFIWMGETLAERYPSLTFSEFTPTVTLPLDSTILSRYCPTILK